MAATSLTTKVSTKGQVILPKAVRQQTGWTPGTTLNVEVTRDGVLLRPASPFPRTKPEDVRGMLRYDGPPKTIEEMDQVSSRRFLPGMLAVDTNVVVRYLVADDREQLARASELIEHGPVLVLSTVMLETEWVLRGVYGFSASAIATALRALSGLPNVTVEDEVEFAHALMLMSHGLDFPDAFHLAGARECDAFATFDKDLARRATKVAPGSVRLL